MNRPPFPEQNVKVVTEQNPWSDPSKISKLTVPGALLLCLIGTLCAIYPAISLTHPQLCPVALLPPLAFLIRTNRTPYGWLLAALTFGAGYTVGGVPTGAALLCVVTAMASASLLSTLSARWLLLVQAAVAYVAALVLCADPVAALAVLPMLIAAAIMGHKTKQNDGRVSVICASSLALGLSCAVILALLWRLSGLPMSVDELSELIATFHDELLALTLNDEYAMMLTQLYEGSGLSAESILSQIVTLILVLTPALFSLLMMLICYTAQYLSCMSYPAIGRKELCTLSARRFIMSVPAALLFVVCSILPFFAGNGLTLPIGVAFNVWLLLFPGMLVVGAWSMLASYMTRRSPLLIILAIVGAFIAPPLFLMFVALSGATTTLTRPLLVRMALLMKSNGNGGDDHSNQPPQP